MVFLHGFDVSITDLYENITDFCESDGYRVQFYYKDLYLQRTRKWPLPIRGKSTYAYVIIFLQKDA